MADLFEQVLHAIEGNDTETLTWHAVDGARQIETKYFGPDRWIKRVHELGRVKPIEVLALVLHAVRVEFDLDIERKIVESWAAELRKAATDDQIQARDADTLLPLGTLPVGWGWLLSMADADKFVADRGMKWTCSEIAAQCYAECFPAMQRTLPHAHLPEAPAAAPVQRTAAQNAAILCCLESLEVDRLKIPQNPAGKPGVKKRVRDALVKNRLFTGTTVFDKAWVRLTASGDIVINS